MVVLVIPVTAGFQRTVGFLGFAGYQENRATAGIAAKARIPGSQVFQGGLDFQDYLE